MFVFRHSHSPFRTLKLESLYRKQKTHRPVAGGGGRKTLAIAYASCTASPRQNTHTYSTDSSRWVRSSVGSLTCPTGYIRRLRRAIGRLVRTKKDGTDRNNLLRISDFAEPAVGYVIDKASHCNLFGNPRVGAQLLQLMTNVFVDILEGVKERGSDGGGSRAIL